MKVVSKTYDSSYFEEEIAEFIEAQTDFRKEDVISITEDDKFTTLWYWWYNAGERE